jgi:hypothetical protein
VVDTVEDTAHLPVTLAVTALPLQATMAVADTAHRAATLVVATAHLPATSAVTALPLQATTAGGDTARRAATPVVGIARLPAALAVTPAPPEAVHQAGGAEVTGAGAGMRPAEAVVVALQAIPAVVHARDAEIGGAEVCSWKGSLTRKV